MQAPKTKGHSCPHSSARQAADNTVPLCQCANSLTLDSVIHDIAQDLGYASRQNLPASLSNKQAACVLPVCYMYPPIP